MAFQHGRDASFGIGTAGAETTVQQIEQYCDELSFPEEMDASQTTTFGQTAHTYVVGMKDTTASVSGKFDPALDDIIGPLLGHETPIDFEYGPVGPDTGDPKYTGKCYVTSYEITSSVSDVVTFSAEFQVTGDVVRTVF